MGNIGEEQKPYQWTVAMRLVITHDIYAFAFKFYIYILKCMLFMMPSKPGEILAQHVPRQSGRHVDLDEEGHPPAHAGPYDTPKDVPPSYAYRGKEVQNAEPECLLIRGCHIINEWPCTCLTPHN